MVGPLDPANWFIRHTNQEWDVFAAAVLPGLESQVKIDTNAGPANVGPDVVSYSPPPFDVVAGPRRVPAAAFAGFPIT